MHNLRRQEILRDELVMPDVNHRRVDVVAYVRRYSFNRSQGYGEEPTRVREHRTSVDSIKPKNV